MKKLLRKILAAVLAVCLVTSAACVSGVSASAAAVGQGSVGASSGTTGDCTWTLDDEGTLTISGNGAVGAYNSKRVKKVVIESGVTSIGDYAFYGCTSLASITIPDSVTSIGDFAFYGCKSLANVTIPDTVTSIGNSAFYGCKSLASITIPDNVIGIGRYTFFGCTSLASITIGNSVTSIGEAAFYECTSLASITIPDSVTSIDYNSPFSGCTSLASITVSSGNLTYDSRNNSNAIIETATNTLIAGCKNTVIPDSVTSIGDGALNYCPSLASITIPDNVTSIGDYAFYYCPSLASITIGSNVTSIGDYAFYGCPSLASITIGNSVTSIGKRAFYGCKSLASITIGNSVTSIGEEAFYECPSLASITIPDSVTSIGDYAFVRSWNLTIYGCTGSAAETYAQKNRIPFREIGQVVYNNSSVLNAVSPSQSVTVKTEESEDLDIGLASYFKFTVPSNVPIFGGGEMSIDLSFIPISAKVEGNNLYVGLGVTDMSKLRSGESNWCSWKNYVKGYRDDIQKGKELLSSKKGIASGGFTPKLKVDFFGYYEATIDNGKIANGAGMAQLKIEGSIKNEWQTAIGFVPIVLKVKGSVSAENKLTLSVGDTNQLKFSNDLTIDLPKITASAGVGIAHVADLSVYGEGKNTIKWTTSPQRITATLYGELGVSAKALFWSAKLPILKWKDGWTYYDSARKSTSSVGANFDLHDESGYAIDRSYLDNQSKWLSASASATGKKHMEAVGSDREDYTVLQSSIFNNAAPKTIKTNNKTIMVWTGDDAKRTTGNQTVVEYSVYDSDTQSWSAPVIVEDNGTADFYPDIATDGTNTFLAWVDANQTFDEDVTIEEMAAACEIKVAKFNSNTGLFENTTRLTDNSTMDNKPSVGIKNGNAVVVWKNNSSNSLFEAAGTNTIYCAKEDNNYSVTSLLSSNETIYELVTDGTSYAYSIDGDNNNNTAEDSEVYGAAIGSTAVNISNNEANDYHLAFSNIGGESVLTYQSGGVICGSTDMATASVLSGEEAMIFGEYQFISDGEVTRLYSVEAVDDNTEIFSYSLNGDGLWANPVQVTDYGKYIQSVSGVIDDNGNTQFTYLLTEAEIGEENITETTDICTQLFASKRALVINEITYDSEEISEGGTLPVNINVTNNGTVDESGMTVKITDEAGAAVVTETLNNILKSGETDDFIINLPLEDNLSFVKDYTVTITSSGDTTSNAKSFAIGYTSLSLWTKEARVDGNSGVLITVENNSSVSTGAALVLRANDAEGDILNTYALKSIAGRSSEQYFLDSDKIKEYKQSCDTLYVEVISYKTEESLADNSDFILINTSYEVGDVNLDGMVNIRDVTQIQRHLAQLELFNDEQLALADANGDGRMTIDDVTLLQMYLAEFDGVILGKQ